MAAARLQSWGKCPRFLKALTGSRYSKTVTVGLNPTRLFVLAYSIVSTHQDIIGMDTLVVTMFGSYSYDSIRLSHFQVGHPACEDLFISRSQRRPMRAEYREAILVRIEILVMTPRHRFHGYRREICNNCFYCFKSTQGSLGTDT